MSLVSQVASSGVNLLNLISLMAVATLAEFGSWSAALGATFFGVTFVRAAFTGPMVAASGISEAAARSMWASGRRRIALVTALVSVVAIVAAVASGLSLADSIILASASPFLIYHEVYRQLAWAQQRGIVAVILDVVWLAVWPFIAGLFWLAGWATPTSMMLAWFLPAIGATLWGYAAVARRWSGDSSSEKSGASAFGLRGLAFSQMILALSANALPIFLAVVFSSEVAGISRALLIPFAPALAIISGLRVVSVPFLKRRYENRSLPAALTSVLSAYVLGSAAVTAITALALGWVPVEWLGDSVAVIKEYVWWGVGLIVSIVIQNVLADGVSMAGSVRRTVVGRAVAMASEWGGIAVGYAVGGTEGLVVGWVAGLILGALAWVISWASTRRTLLSGTG